MKLVMTEYMSLDGIMENPEWVVPYIDNDFLKFKFDELFTGDALLMGRKTYEMFLPIWASGETMEDAPGQEGFAARVENLPKYVVSTSLKTSHWNNTQFINENPVESIRALKQQSGQNILVAGSANLMQTLMHHKLVDEIRILVFPVIVGHGKHLFDVQNTTSLDLISIENFKSGVIAVTYQPKYD